MVRDREKTFIKYYLNYSGKKIHKHIKPSLDSIVNTGLYEEVMSVYKNLGGILEVFPYRFGPYDLPLSDMIIELDEEAHFNRYREITLDSTLYNDQSNKINVNNYKNQCRTKEHICLKNRSGLGFWTNPTSEKQFGKSNVNRDLDMNGSARWKQRAFYDYLRDLIPQILGIPIYRVSIYDVLKDGFGKRKTVNDILINYDEKGFKMIYEAIDA